MKIGFIGIGVLGKGLALALADQGYAVVAAHSRTPDSAQWLADRVPGCSVYSSAQSLTDAADLVFITTPDGAIQQVASSVSWRKGQAVVHCCGAASTELLASAAQQGASTGAFHPFQTFAGMESPAELKSRLLGVAFAVTAQGWLLDTLKETATRLGGRAIAIRDEDRPLYHASAVLGCGYLAALLDSAVGLWQAMGFSEAEALQALRPLAGGTLDSISKGNLAGAVTGPAVRGDVATLRAHLEALENKVPETVALYVALTRASVPLAKAKGVSPDQLLALQTLAEEYRGRSD